jgi:hypothetical protein
MTRDTQPSPIGPRPDLRTDYVLMAAALGAALLALIYLVLN